eukprot:COSAG01_NODE_1611_length_9738_cov_22.481689_6_plen_161_part_00
MWRPRWATATRFRWSIAVVHGCSRCVCVRMFFQPAQSNFGKSEAISYVNPSKFRPGGQQQFSYSQTPRSRQDLRGVRGVCVRLPTSESGCSRPAPSELERWPRCFSPHLRCMLSAVDHRQQVRGALGPAQVIGDHAACTQRKAKPAPAVRPYMYEYSSTS